MKSSSLSLEFILTAVALLIFAFEPVHAEDWISYAGCSGGAEGERTLKDWYGLNRMKPVPMEKATMHHYYDRENLGYNSPFAGGIVRVWEKTVLQKGTRTYKEAREEIEREEEIKLKRKISVIDYAWLFPLAVSRATKEIETLIEINCDSKEFYILEVNSYDKTGHRLTREANFDANLWIAIQPGTVMEVLSKEICR